MTVPPIWQPDPRAPGGGYWAYPPAAPPPVVAMPEPFDPHPPYTSPAESAMKNGFRTSEFWITAGAIVLPPLLDQIGPAVSTLAGPWGIVAAAAYSIARGLVKFAAVRRSSSGAFVPPAGWTGVAGAPPYQRNWNPPPGAAAGLKDAPPAYATDEEAIAAGWIGGKGI